MQKDGLNHTCRECQKYFSHLDYEKHKLERSEGHRRWKENNPGYMARYSIKYNQTPRGKYRTYKTEAKSRGISFDLTFEEFMAFWQKPCIYNPKHSIGTIGLDRIDNTKGYIVGNIVPCCHPCNWMKKDMSVDEWLDHMEGVVKHMRGQRDEQKA